MSEPEIIYNLGLFKQKMAKNKDKGLLKQLHRRAIYTAKVLTKQTVESQTPICMTLSKHDTVNKENIKLLMYRIQKMYQVKQDA